MQLNQLPPLSLYIHIPWCIKKCPYCDFNSHNSPPELPEKAYIAALTKDLELALPLIWGRMIRTIFIGGGTPSLFSGDGINQILTMIRILTNLSPLAEITLEANPGTIDSEHIVDYAKAGVNRISFGVQSFNDRHLKNLGRIHDSKQAIAAINLAQSYFKRINLDIMYGLPDQTIAEALEDINRAIAFDPEHISCYNLTIEPNTKFYTDLPSNLPDNDLCYKMQDALITQLINAGYERYEISAYAKPGFECEHNLNYWQFGDYLGIGAGSHSKLSFPDKIIRQIRQKQPQNYISSIDTNQHIIENKVVKKEELSFEFMLNSLRLTKGYKTTLFVERTGLGLNEILAKLDVAATKGFIELKGGNITPTKLGCDFQNDLLMLFL